MLDALQFVKGAVARKDYQPALTHFRLSAGRVTGFNGKIALSSPIPLDIDAMPRAVPFVKAIESCTKETAVHMTSAGKLALKSGKFRAYIDCFDDDALFQEVRPEGQALRLSQPLLPALRVLSTFIGEDASRPWATGILLRGESGYATNNIVLIEFWLGGQFPIPLNLPKAAVEEVLRIGVEPDYLVAAERSLTFVYPGDRWLRTILLDPDEWPPIIGDVLAMDCDPKPIPDGFFETVETLIPFADEVGHIYFREGVLRTIAKDEDAGASVEFAGLPAHGAFNHKYLMQLRGVATSVDFDAHPKPCGFRGDMLRGTILGLIDE